MLDAFFSAWWFSCDHKPKFFVPANRCAEMHVGVCANFSGPISQRHLQQDAQYPGLYLGSVLLSGKKENGHWLFRFCIGPAVLSCPHSCI